jgi:hypothetical protein
MLFLPSFVEGYVHSIDVPASPARISSLNHYSDSSPFSAIVIFSIDATALPSFERVISCQPLNKKW